MKLLYLGLSLTAIALAQKPDSPYFYFYGKTSYPPYNNTAFTSFEPNATREVSFDRAQTLTAGRNWTWTLSIRDVALPDIKSLNTTLENTPDARAAYTSYSFNWPQDGNVNEAVSRTGTQCLYNIFTTFPQNVSNAWDSSSSCASAIGTDCELYIVNQMSNQRGCEANNVPALFSAPECASSFGVVTEGITTYGYAFGNDSASGNSTAFEKGETVAWTLSEPYSPSNTTAFEIAKNRIHIAIIGNGYGTRVLCNRVGDGLEVKDTAEEADGEDDSEDNGDMEVSEGEEGSSMRNTFSVAFVGLTTLFVTALGSM